ncbi:MAG: hypothetical protein U1E50_11320 [Caulobacteraceae bacterium]
MRPFEIRPCAREDIPAVVRLIVRDGAIAAGVSRAEIEAYAARLYFDNPWADPAIGSHVCVDPSGALEGFVGVMPRRMRFGSETFTAAVPGNFVVRPGGDGKVNSFAALAMLRKVFAGPQDLTFTDTANDASKRLWEAAGAIDPGLASLDWVRPIKPATAILNMVDNLRPGASPVVAAAGLATRAVDLAGAPILAAMHARRAGPASYSRSPLIASDLLDMLTRHGKRDGVAGDYDKASLEWLLRELHAKAAGRRLLEATVLDGEGAKVGAYILVLERGGAAHVLLHTAREGRHDLVLQALVADAATHGAAMVTGPVQPRQMAAYKAQRTFLMGRTWTLIHTRRPDLKDAFLHHKTGLAGIEGERWTRFADLFWI